MKDLLNKIFPDASQPSGEVFAAPAVDAQLPEERILAMRKIRGSSGFARLYGAKDVEQFIRQAQYMADFTDDYPREILYSDSMPTYADMSAAQLRCYFTWRTKTWSGHWQNTSYPYVLLRLFELLNSHEEPEETAAALAECWLHMRQYHPQLDAKIPQWLKDYYICHTFQTPFGELAESLGLAAFFPARTQQEKLLSLSSYSCRESRFFREMPEMFPVLEQALEAAIVNVSPLFRLYGVNEDEAFYLQPARFSFHEMFSGAAALPPVQSEASREVRISHSEIYRQRGGSWSRAAQNAFRPPSHAVGYVAKRLEAALRQCAGFDAPWSDPQAAALRERWLHVNPRAYALAEDPRLAAIITETAQSVYAKKSADSPASAALSRTLEQEPMRTILSLREITGSTQHRFLVQGKRLAHLADDYREAVSYTSEHPHYGEMTPAQLRCYITWRSKLREGTAEQTDTAYALLYAAELQSGIGTQEPLEALCRFLVTYAALDRILARRLPALITDFAQANAIQQLPALLTQYGVQRWFPSLFLFTDCDQLPLYEQLSSYAITRSRFYRSEQAALFSACFAQVLQAAEQAFRQAGLDFRRSMQGAHAAALATFLLKRMEHRLRKLVHYPYAITADPAQILRKAIQGRKKLRSFLSSGGALPMAIDGAVDAFAKANDLTVLAAAKRPAHTKRALRASNPLPEPEPAPAPVTVDFSLLPDIRAKARAITERLIVEEQAQPLLPAPQPIVQNEAESSALPLGEALTPQQLAIAEYLCSRNGTAPVFDELQLEAINEAALAAFGDILIEQGEHGPQMVAEYRENWETYSR